MTSMFDKSTLVEQVCGDCIIRIGTWKYRDTSPGEVVVEIISSGTGSYNMLRNRIKNAWNVLRGRYDWTGFEVYTEEEIDGIIGGLTEAKGVAFPQVTDLGEAP